MSGGERGCSDVQQLHCLHVAHHAHNDAMCLVRVHATGTVSAGPQKTRDVHASTSLLTGQCRTSGAVNWPMPRAGSSARSNVGDCDEARM